MGPEVTIEARDDARDLTWGDYAAVVRRYWWAVVLVVIAATVVAYAISAASPNRFKASAKLVNTSYVTDVTLLTVDVNTASATITSPSVRSAAAASMGRLQPAAGDFSVSAAPTTLSGALSSSVNPTRVIIVTAEAGTAHLAARVATAYAYAFVQYRQRSDRKTARKSLKSVREQLAAYETPGALAGDAFLTSAYVSLKQRLSQLEATATSGDGGYAVLAAAEPPSAPFSPKPVRNAILGFGVGLFVAFGIVLVLQRFGPGVGGEREVASLLNLPILGRISCSRDERSESGGLVSLATPTGSDAEAYRRLRTSLLRVALRADATTLLFANARGLEGADLVLANLAVAAARAGKRVVVVDANLRNGSLHRRFGLSNDIGLTSVCSGRASLGSALQTVALGSDPQSSAAPTTAGSRDWPAVTLNVLTSGPGVPDLDGVIAGHATTKVFADLKQQADIVFIASSALLETADASIVADSVDGLVFVVDARSTGRRALRETRELLSLLPCRLIGMVLTNRHAVKSASTH
jgi:Mrp family chromosome partitioning ATPase